MENHGEKQETGAAKGSKQDLNQDRGVGGGQQIDQADAVDPTGGQIKKQEQNLSDLPREAANLAAQYPRPEEYENPMLNNVDETQAQNDLIDLNDQPEEDRNEQDQINPSNQQVQAQEPAPPDYRTRIHDWEKKLSNLELVNWYEAASKKCPKLGDDIGFIISYCVSFFCLYYFLFVIQMPEMEPKYNVGDVLVITSRNLLTWKEHEIHVGDDVMYKKQFYTAIRTVERIEPNAAGELIYHTAALNKAWHHVYNPNKLDRIQRKDIIAVVQLRVPFIGNLPIWASSTFNLGILAVFCILARLLTY